MGSASFSLVQNRIIWLFYASRMIACSGYSLQKMDPQVCHSFSYPFPFILPPSFFLEQLHLFFVPSNFVQCDGCTLPLLYSLSGWIPRHSTAGRPVTTTPQVTKEKEKKKEGRFFKRVTKGIGFTKWGGGWF